MKTQKRYAWILAAATAASVFTTAHAHSPGDKLDAFDLNGDGNITKEEFAAASANSVKELQDNFLAKYDSVPQGQTVGDGVITPEESSAVHEALAADWLDHLLEIFDTNDDGVISDADKSRFGRSGAHRHFLGEYDTDDDGVISAKELEAAKQARAGDLQDRFLEKYDSVPEGAKAGDGTITKEESLAVHQAIVQEKVKAILDRYDANDDGAVTAEEIDAVNAKRSRGPFGGHRDGPHR
jgi:Ca2+-binding EF-hand superfamily protein